MACGNNNNNRCRGFGCGGNDEVSVVRGERGLIGPQGPRGEQGATGQNGASGVADGVYAGNQTIVLGNGIMPILLLGGTPNTTISLSGNQLILPVGTYFVTFGFIGEIATGGIINIVLYQGGVSLPNERATCFSNGHIVTASKSIIISSGVATTLSIYNQSGVAVNFSSINLSALKLN